MQNPNNVESLILCYFCQANSSVHVIAPNSSNYSINVGLTCLMHAYIIYYQSNYMTIIISGRYDTAYQYMHPCDHVYAFWFRV